MALRSPTEYHNFWGQFAAYTDLPNVAGSGTQSGNLQTGDTAYVTGTNQLYFCTVDTLGAAAWGVAGGADHFAPRYLVGNVLNGDSPTPYYSDGFTYFPDTGDGAGIEAALAAADTSAGGVRGDVWIRPGTYDLNTGAVATPMTIPVGVRVQGAGGAATIIQGRASATGDQGIFVMKSSTQLSNITVAARTSDAVGVGSKAVVLIDGAAILVQSAVVNMNAQTGAFMDTAVLVSGSEEPWQDIKILGCSIGGGDYGVHFANNGDDATLANSTVTGCFVNAVRVDADVTNCRVVGCFLLADYKTIAPVTVSVSGDRNVVSSNSIKAKGSAGGGADGIGVQITADHNACVSNEIKLTHGTIAIDVSGDDSVVVANVSGATTPVQNTGAGNEIAHNI